MKLKRIEFKTPQECIEHIIPLQEEIINSVKNNIPLSFDEPELEIWTFAKDFQKSVVICKDSKVEIEDRKTDKYIYYDFPQHTSKTTLWDEYMFRYYAKWHQEGVENVCPFEVFMEALKLNGVENIFTWGFPENDIYVWDNKDPKIYYKLVGIYAVPPSDRNAEMKTINYQDENGEMKQKIELINCSWKWTINTINHKIWNNETNIVFIF